MLYQAKYKSDMVRGCHLGVKSKEEQGDYGSTQLLTVWEQKDWRVDVLKELKKKWIRTSNIYLKVFYCCYYPDFFVIEHVGKWTRKHARKLLLLWRLYPTTWAIIERYYNILSMVMSLHRFQTFGFQNPDYMVWSFQLLNWWVTCPRALSSSFRLGTHFSSAS
jgi:hypothetical protein